MYHIMEQGAVHLSCDTKLTLTRPPPPFMIQGDISHNLSISCILSKGFNIILG